MSGQHDQPTREYIRRHPLLAAISAEDANALAGYGILRTFRRGSQIVREGEPGDSFHTIIEGRVRIAMTSAAGTEATLALLGRGDSFGELSLFDGRSRSASALALTPTRTLAVEQADFRRWLSERPRVAIGLLEALSLRLRQTDEKLADFSFRTPKQRLAHHLLAAAAAQERDAVASAPEPSIRITQAELGSLLGVSRESVNKQLREFEKQGWVTLGRGRVTIRSLSNLQAIAGSSGTTR